MSAFTDELCDVTGYPIDDRMFAYWECIAQYNKVQFQSEQTLRPELRSEWVKKDLPGNPAFSMASWWIQSGQMNPRVFSGDFEAKDYYCKK